LEIHSGQVQVDKYQKQIPLAQCMLFILILTSTATRCVHNVSPYFPSKTIFLLTLPTVYYKPLCNENIKMNCLHTNNCPTLTASYKINLVSMPWLSIQDFVVDKVAVGQVHLAFPANNH
jgi:hypothetical protein